MKRSHINEIIRESDAFFRSHGFTLPPFASWTPEEFQARKSEAKAVIDARCGWDVTDFGAGRYDSLGLSVFTLRNGRLADLQKGRGMCYAEKLLVVGENQVTPCHTHVIKSEDIINRGGATLVVELFGSDEEGRCSANHGGQVFCDGIAVPYGPGQRVRLAPGESITLVPGDWHAFWGEGGTVLAGEVSTVNDDENDNIFRDPLGRFSDIEEDEPPFRLLVSDYRARLG